MLESSRILRAVGCVVATGLLATARVAEWSDVLSAAGAPRIAFASHRDGDWEIYVTDADGGHQTRLTTRQSQDRFALWSPDRSRIAFGSQVGGNHWELWVMNADGTKPRFLATNIVAKGHREWSHDGTRIVFAGTIEGDREIFCVDVTAGRLIRLTNSRGDDADPSWSPDDRRLVFSSTRDGNQEIYMMNADGTQPSRITNGAAPAVSPAWAPDGSRIAFISGRGEDRDVHLVRVDDGRVQRLTTGAHATNDGARWSPNGAYIGVQTADRGYDIQIVRTVNGERWTVAGSPAYDGQFSWSPASDQLAFISGRDGVDAVYVTDLTGKATRLTATPSLNPEWSP
jgi:Tol biopolymer transport system component